MDKTYYLPNPQAQQLVSQFNEQITVWLNYTLKFNVANNNFTNKLKFTFFLFQE